jgi:hypothetical protein
MLQGQGSQVCVRDKVGNGLPITQHLLKHLPMALRGTHNPHRRLLDPTLYATDRLVEGKWMFEDPRVGADADECTQNGPAEAHRGTTG